MSYYDDFIDPYIGSIDDEPDLVHDTTWATKNDKIMKVYEMETSHLENTLTMLEQKDKEPPYLTEKELYIYEEE